MLVQTRCVKLTLSLILFIFSSLSYNSFIATIRTNTYESPRQVDQNREKQLPPLSPTGENARILGTDSHKLQLMKASFFDGESDEEISEAVYDRGK